MLELGWVDKQRTELEDIFSALFLEEKKKKGFVSIYLQRGDLTKAIKEDSWFRSICAFYGEEKGEGVTHGSLELEIESISFEREKNDHFRDWFWRGVNR